eukprot:CAMPEP_0171632328 /NCGR_PEP_ID=MMETSP0990-20121206/24344_1 /TAXON_ID=483369 /ORGANISM="non described non described, Strain CCMP2098" /LENGTH=53 /DNA_ID=CAMNT_0012202437 /DNA_START=744 /DNA_END=902 /DNA_ORIENTATION=-
MSLLQRDAMASVAAVVHSTELAKGRPHPGASTRSMQGRPMTGRPWHLVSGSAR